MSTDTHIPTLRTDALVQKIEDCSQSGKVVALGLHEVGAVNRDTLMYSMLDLDDDMKAAMEGGER